MNNLIKRTANDMGGICGFSYFKKAEVKRMIKKAIKDGMITHKAVNNTLNTMDYYKGEKLMLRIPLNQLG